MQLNYDIIKGKMEKRTVKKGEKKVINDFLFILVGV